MTLAGAEAWDVLTADLKTRADALRAEALRLGIRWHLEFKCAAGEVLCGLHYRDLERVERAVRLMDQLLTPHRLARRRWA